MKKILKITGKSLLVLLLLLLTAYLVMYLDVRGRMNRQYSFTKETLAVERDGASVAAGRHLVAIRGCNDCHGENFGGKLLNDDAFLGTLVAPNLTKGTGGLPADYAVSDWLTALRHGVNRNGKPLQLMPSNETALLSKKDLADIIAYAQSLPPVATRMPAQKLGPVAYVMGYLDKMPLLAVEKITHNAVIEQEVMVPGSVEQGRYLVTTCQSCHRPSMKGSNGPAPGMPPVPDITSTGAAGKTTLRQFTTALRTGKKADGKQMNNDDMPWKMTSQYTDEEIKAIYSYVRSL